MSGECILLSKRHFSCNAQLHRVLYAVRYTLTHTHAHKRCPTTPDTRRHIPIILHKPVYEWKNGRTAWTKMSHTTILGQPIHIPYLYSMLRPLWWCADNNDEGRERERATRRNGYACAHPLQFHMALCVHTHTDKWTMMSPIVSIHHLLISSIRWHFISINSFLNDKWHVFIYLNYVPCQVLLVTAYDNAYKCSPFATTNFDLHPNSDVRFLEWTPLNSVGCVWTISRVPTQINMDIDSMNEKWNRPRKIKSKTKRSDFTMRGFGRLHADVTIFKFLHFSQFRRLPTSRGLRFPVAHFPTECMNEWKICTQLLFVIKHVHINDVDDLLPPKLRFNRLRHSFNRYSLHLFFSCSAYVQRLMCV